MLNRHQVSKQLVASVRLMPVKLDCVRSTTHSQSYLSRQVHEMTFCLRWAIRIQEHCQLELFTSIAPKIKNPRGLFKVHVLRENRREAEVQMRTALISSIRLPK